MIRSPFSLLFPILVVAVAPALVTTPAAAQVTVAGSGLVPKELLFSVMDERSRVAGEGALPSDCKWRLGAETAVAQSPQEECTAFFYRTTVTLVRSCPDPKKPQAAASERTLLAGRSCPSKSFEPETEARIVSSGTNSDGKRQEIVVLADGTRLTIVWSPQDVQVNLRYPDGSADVLKVDGK